MCATLKYVIILEFDKERFKENGYPCLIRYTTEILRSLNCQKSFPVTTEVQAEKELGEKTSDTSD